MAYDNYECKMTKLSAAEIEQVSGAATGGQVLNAGAAITAVGAAVLVAVGSPLLVPAAAAFGITSGLMWAGSALMDMGFHFGGGAPVNLHPPVMQR
ncbi:MAG: hypothetical protein M3R60_17960 [Pseudomonadota bacterium]|nr:hypothetical protein [Pseudomonadota bacterium]